MKILLKKYSVFLLLFSSVFSSKGQFFSLTDSIPTEISAITYKFLPVQSNENFNLLFYSLKNKKQNFELYTLKNTSVSRIEIKNRGLDGGGSWYKSAAMLNEKLILLHVDGFLLVYKKNKRGNYSLKETLNIKGRHFNKISFLDSETIILMSYYNWYNEEKLYNNYALCVFDLRTKKVTYQKEIDLGKGILLSHFSSTVSMESKKDKIAVAHPTSPLIYIYDNKLNLIDTIYAQFQDTISVDSVINAAFPDAFLERNKTYAKEIIETIEKGKINQMERIEKVFWLSDDILGYTIRQPFSSARMFVFYSISERKELYKKISDDEPLNFNSSTRVLINNNKTIWYSSIYGDDESDIYYMFYLYDWKPFNSTE